MAEPFRDLSEVHFNDIRLGIPSIPDHIPTSWTPNPEHHQMHSAERTRFSMNSKWADIMLHSNLQTFDYSNIVPIRGPIVAGISLTHRPMANFGPELEFGEECKSMRPNCPTCSEIDTLCFAGMDAIQKVSKEKRDLLVAHLRKRVQHCGYQAARADHFGYSWHKEGNNASMVLHHFHMANLETERRKQLQPPVHRPPPIVISPPPAETHHPPTASFSSAPPSMTFTMVTAQVEQHAQVREAPRSNSYTDAVKGGKRPAANHAVHESEVLGASQPKQDMRNRNMDLLDPNYSPNGGQVRVPTPNNLQTPRPAYSPVTPTEVQRYLSPGTPCFQGPSNAEQGNFHPSNHLSRLTTRSFETSNDETALECAKHMLGLQ